MKRVLHRALSVILILALMVTMLVVSIVPTQAGMITNIVNGNFTAVAFELMERSVVTVILKPLIKATMKL